ncbi:transferase hexapeptide (six repeat-containing protein) [Devosia sp. YR412]|uniref:acyltransferase n=1 Tax=Devosia sp. YR412 TaxID=1881030 RepID=UPI0008BDB231|nr:acyltransferase [Devosia sp. YR412]SEQ53659.1 transferase hexapeptide (six repeat-containing protein) [Devosia sp. YR412]
MGLLKRGFSRLALHVLRIVLLPVELVDARRYMDVYTWLLRRYGLQTRGKPRYISSKARFDDLNLVTIGDRAVLSKYVILLTHDYSVTTALRTLGEAPETDIGVKRPITIGDNVFIGMNVILLPGTTIGDNVIIGAGSVVRGKIADDSIVVGNPGQVIGTISERAERWRALATSDGAFRDKK